MSACSNDGRLYSTLEISVAKYKIVKESQIKRAIMLSVYSVADLVEQLGNKITHSNLTCLYNITYMDFTV